LLFGGFYSLIRLESEFRIFPVFHLEFELPVVQVTENIFGSSGEFHAGFVDFGHILTLVGLNFDPLVLESFIPRLGVCRADLEPVFVAPLPLLDGRTVLPVFVVHLRLESHLSFVRVFHIAFVLLLAVVDDILVLPHACVDVSIARSYFVLQVWTRFEQSRGE